jgi:hypothetical protein
MKKILSIIGILGVLCVGLVKAESRYSTDVLTGAMVTSPTNAADIHAGNNFFVGITTQSLTYATTAQFFIDAKAISSFTLHVDFAVVVTTQSCLVEVYENSTFASTGTATSAINLNRESVKTLPGGYRIYLAPIGINAPGTLLYSFLAVQGINVNDFNYTGLEISAARTKTLLISVTPLGVTTGISMRVIMQALKR